MLAECSRSTHSLKRSIAKAALYVGRMQQSEMVAVVVQSRLKVERWLSRAFVRTVEWGLYLVGGKCGAGPFTSRFAIRVHDDNGQDPTPFVIHRGGAANRCQSSSRMNAGSGTGDLATPRNEGIVLVGSDVRTLRAH